MIMWINDRQFYTNENKIIKMMIKIIDYWYNIQLRDDKENYDNEDAKYI